MLIVAVACSLVAVGVGYANEHRRALGAAGVMLGPRRGIRLGFRAFALNTVVKSGGLAGMSPYLRHAEQSAQSTARTRTGYLIANLLGDVAIAVMVVPTIVVLAVAGKATLPIITGAVIFAGYLAIVASLVVAAARSRDALRRIHAWPTRLHNKLLPRRAPRSIGASDVAADEMHDAVRMILQKPASMLPAFGWALTVDMLGVAGLAAVTRAFGLSLGAVTLFSAYSVALLFSLIGILPGGLGFAEVSLGALLVASGVAAPTAVAVTLVFRVIETWLPAAIGMGASTRARRTNHVRVAVTVNRQTHTGRDVRVRHAVTIATGLFALSLLAVAARRHPFVDLGAAAFDPRAISPRGSRYLLLVAAVVLASSLRGLARGARSAWRVAVLTLILTTMVLPFGRRDLVGAAVAAVFVATLLVMSKRFRTGSEPITTRDTMTWLSVGLGVVTLYATVGLWMLDTEVGEAMPLWRAFDTSLRVLFVLPSTTLKPESRHAVWFIDSVRFLSAALVLVTVMRLARPVMRRRVPADTDRALVGQILRDHATTSLAFFQLLGDKSYVFSGDRRAFVGYRRVGNVAVALGEPVGPADSQHDAAVAFIDECDQNGWVPTFHQLTEQGARITTGCGFHVLKIGEEAIVDVRTFSLSGSHFKRLRSQLRKLEADGLSIEELPRPITDDTMTELREISDAWMTDGAHRERTFTLGHFNAQVLQETPVLVARTQDRIEAFVNIIPSYHSTDGNFDMMRRRPDSPNGVMDALMVALIQRFNREGRHGLNLGLAPLANLDGDSLPERTLRRIADHDSKAFNFDGLRAYKSKWNPIWEPRFLAYPTEAALPRIGYAVARVGELRATAPLLLRLGLPDTTVAELGQFLDSAHQAVIEATPEVDQRATAVNPSPSNSSSTCITVPRT